MGNLLRYILNINTVWGLMILIAFGACLAQHYLPTTTIIPAKEFQPGENILAIRIKKPGDEVKAFEYKVALASEGLILPVDQQIKNKERPWLIGSSEKNGAYLLRWDYDGYGDFELIVNASAGVSGKLVTLQSLTDAALEYAKKGFDIALGLVAAMVMFLGLMKVGEDAGIVQLVARVFHPLIGFLFPGIPKDHPASGAVLMNMTTSILGLGNAATPFGLKAMKELHSLNPHPAVATDAQVMLIAYNTAGFALIPTMLLGVRKSAGCSDPFEIIGTCMITGATSTIVALIMAKLLAKLPFFSVRTALAEEEREAVAASLTPKTSPESSGPTTDRKEG